MCPAPNDLDKTPYGRCLDWIYEQKNWVEGSRYGRNKKSVLDALDEQNQKAKVISDYQREINKVSRQISDEDDKKHLQEAYDSLTDASQKKINCLQTMLGITSLEEHCVALSHEFDVKAVDLAGPLAGRELTSGDVNIMGFLAPSSQDCVFAAQDNWNWIVKLVSCIDTHLKKASAYHQFFHEVDESSLWLEEDLNRLHKSFENFPISGEYQDAERLLEELKDVGTSLRQWDCRIERMWKDATQIVPVILRTSGVKEPTPARSLCNYDTAEVSVHEGEDLLVLDNSHTQLWRVRNARGQEFDIPAVCVLIPGPFKQAIDAAVKMRLQLLATWTDTLKKMGQRIICFMLMVFKPDYKMDEIEVLKNIRLKDKAELLRILDKIEDTLKTHWSDHEGFMNLQERMLMLRMILEQMGSDELKDENQYRALVVQITMLEKIVEKYKDLWRDWENFKVSSEASRSPELMLIADKWEQLKFVPRDYFAKFWKSELPFDEVEKTLGHLKRLTGEGGDDMDGISEEGFDETIVKTTTVSTESSRNGSKGSGSRVATYGAAEEGFSEEGFDEERVVETKIGYEESSARGEHVEGGEFGYATETKTAETEQISAAESEEKKTFIIRAVIDPFDENNEISLQDAIVMGIIKPDEGMYTNTQTGESIPIPLAMSQGLIKVQFTSTKRSKEKKSSMGIITVKTVKEVARPYKILQVKDTLRDEWMDQDVAKEKRILDDKHAIFYSRKSGREMLMTEAIEKGWVEVEYTGEASEPEVVQQAYAVRAVVDRRQKKTITFNEAIRRGIIDKDTGAFRDTLTGDSMYVGDAIMRGFLKARPVDDTKNLNIDPRNKMMIDKTEAIKKKLLQPLSVINAFKRAAQMKKM